MCSFYYLPSRRERGTRTERKICGGALACRQDSRGRPAPVEREPGGRERVYEVGSTPQISAPFWYTVTVCVSLYTKLGSEMKE
jgi:hypothetical protein